MNAVPALAPGHAARLGLIWTLVRTDFKTRYQPTFGGFLWALAKPLVMFVVLMSVFSLVFGTDTRYRLNLVLGLFLYDFFGEATKLGLASLQSKGYLLTKVKSPAWIFVVASASNPLITLGVFSMAIMTLLAATGRFPGLPMAVLFVVYLAEYAIIVAGFSLAASVLFLRYRDLNQIWEVVAHAGFFVAPIIYPLDIIPERFHFYLYLWPPTPIMQFSRAVLVDGVAPTLRAQAFLALETTIVLVVGIVVFRRFAPRVAEYI